MTPKKADVSRRITAAVIDMVIALILYWVFLRMIVFFEELMAPLVASAYLAFKDALPGVFDGTSIGKKMLRLRAVTGDGRPCDFGSSLTRNAPFAVPWAGYGLSALIPHLLGAMFTWILFFLLLFACFYELVKVINEAQGIRWGDSQAGTLVVETES